MFSMLFGNSSFFRFVAGQVQWLRLPPPPPSYIISCENRESGAVQLASVSIDGEQQSEIWRPAAHESACKPFIFNKITAWPAILQRNNKVEIRWLFPYLIEI
jgi:hypothetical protein